MAQTVEMPAEPTAILDALFAHGFNVTWDWPGLARLHITPTIQVNTGLHSWAYGTASRLIAHAWEPAEDVDEYATLDIGEDETDPGTIAKAWAAWATEHFGDETTADPTARDYVVGLPVMVTVRDDGTVTYVVDTAEAGAAVAEDREVTATVRADMERIEADHNRRRGIIG